MAHDLPNRNGVRVARQLIVDAIAHLDAAPAPPDIAAHLGLALYRIDQRGLLAPVGGKGDR